MAIFMPSWVTPDLRSGLGLGTVDATQDLTVSWKITGQSALTKFEIVIYANDANSTQLYTTGELTDGCPAYGTTSSGDVQFFSYTIDAANLVSAGITNGNEYKLLITQWWSANDSVTQSSASAFITRSAPSLAIDTIGTGGVINTRYYTFTGTYAQSQGDVLNWFRWRIAYADDTDDIIFDSENISGTMDISCYFDGFFDSTNYSIRLTCQTENGIEADTGWVNFSASYAVSSTTGQITAGCVSGTDAVLVEWSGIGYVPGEATGDYYISDDNILTLPIGSSIAWDTAGSGAMDFETPWSIVWKGTLSATNTAIFTIGQSTGDITLSYDYSTSTLTLSKGGTVLISQSGIINAPAVTIILTASNLYIRSDYMTGGLYPTASLYPSTSLYPDEDDTAYASTYTLTPTYTQENISSVSISGLQTCVFIEVIDGTASAETIAAAITNGNYTPGLNDSDYMMADWTNDINAGALNIGGDTLQGYALYRRQGTSGRLVKVIETDISTEKVYDYGAASQQGPYTYYLFPIGATTYIASPLTSGMVMPCWWNWTLMECEETDDANIFSVIKAYRFKYNIQTAATVNNNTPNVLHNFTPYPKIQLAPQNYKSSSLSGLIGMIDWSNGQPEYVDTIALRDAIYALSLTQNALFLKNRKGDILRVRISGPISMQTADATMEQIQEMSLPWAETGSAVGISLYSSVYVGEPEAEGESTPQYYIDTSDATADATEILIEKTAYGADGKIIGDAEITIDGKTLQMPEGMVR